MVLGQSSATAAVHAIEQGTTIQEIDYAKLKARLEADGQMLDFESPPIPEIVTLTKEQLGGIVVDDGEAQLTGFDSIGHTTPGFLLQGYRHDSDAGKGQQKARFIPNIPQAGKYRVAITYGALANRASNVPVTIHHAGGDTTVTVNQKKAGAEKGLLQPVGTYQFEAGQTGYVEISNTGTQGHVIIDAVQFLPAP